MDKIFENVDEVLADDDFLAWYFKSDDTRANEWKNWMNQNPGTSTWFMKQFKRCNTWNSTRANCLNRRLRMLMAN